MIIACLQRDVGSIYEIVNDAAQAYKGVIPSDRYHGPYMSKDELRREIAEGVEFYGYREKSRLEYQRVFEALGIKLVDRVGNDTINQNGSPRLRKYLS